MKKLYIFLLYLLINNSFCAKYNLEYEQYILRIYAVKKLIYGNQ